VNNVKGKIKRVYGNYKNDSEGEVSNRKRGGGGKKPGRKRQEKGPTIQKVKLVLDVEKSDQQTKVEMK